MTKDIRRYRAVSLCFAALTLFLCLSGCGGRAGSRQKVLEIFERYHDQIAQAAASGDYETLRKNTPVRQVEAHDDGNTVRFFCTGAGLGSATSYYGVLWLADDDPLRYFSGWDGEVTAEEDEWLWRERGGDNMFRLEKLEDCFYFFEEHY